MAFKKALIERAMGGELAHHLGYANGGAKPAAGANQRNGKSGETVITGEGPVRVEIPRDRDGSFEPLLISKHERRFTGFDDKIIAMYARGMTMREIQGFLLESYGTQVSAEFISSVTEAVMLEVTTWQARPLDPMDPVVFFDALRVKIKEDAVVRNKAIYLALGVQRDGTRDILGLWIEGTEGAKFWMKVFNDLKTRGVEDILIAVTDGLKGMPEALTAAITSRATWRPVRRMRRPSWTNSKPAHGTRSSPRQHHRGEALGATWLILPSREHRSRCSAWMREPL